MTQRIAEQEIILKIQQQEPIDAILPNGSLHIIIRDYAPYVATAIHNGRRLARSLQSSCLLTDKERLYEEDPYTGQLAAAFPVSVTALDSRYEYDLNRNPQSCIYDHAWGKQVWRKQHTNKQRQTILEKHASYYRIMNALVHKLEQLHGKSIIFDIHSYNSINRGYQDPPEFNIGTSQINKNRWRKAVTTLKNHLHDINIDNIMTQARLDDVFQGKGYQATHGKKHWQESVVIPLEVKKFYMDERSGELYPVVFEALCRELHNACLATASLTIHPSSRKLTKKKEKIEPLVLHVDQELYKIASSFETLHYINPTNLKQEHKRFFSQRQRYVPNFKYRPLKIDPYQFREAIYRLPVSYINDPTLKYIFREIVDAYATKVDLLTSVGTDNFIYNSLRYYGEPNQQDLRNANFLLYAKETQHELASCELDDILHAFEIALADYQIDCQVEISKKLAAKAMVDHSQKKILINPDIKITQTDLRALINHELGVHMVTTMNSHLQKLRVFSLGMPMNTHTQEGLAVLSEYLSGSLTITRLHILALRVIAVKQLLQGESFYNCYDCLTDDYGIESETAFSIVARVYRGGGFTKDYLYLRGLIDVLKTYKSRPIDNLLVGKTSLTFLDSLDELRVRGIVTPIKHRPKYLKKHRKSDAIIDYLLSCLSN